MVPFQGTFPSFQGVVFSFFCTTTTWAMEVWLGYKPTMIGLPDRTFRFVTYRSDVGLWRGGTIPIHFCKNRTQYSWESEGTPPMPDPTNYRVVTKYIYTTTYGKWGWSDCDLCLYTPDKSLVPAASRYKRVHAITIESMATVDILFFTRFTA